MIIYYGGRSVARCPKTPLLN